MCALRAKPPEAVTKRLKLFLYSPAGVGKTTASIQFPRSYIIDGEKGSENYDQLIRASESVVLQTTDMHDVVAEVKSLLTEKHEYRTLVIDPITTLYNDLLDKAEQKVGNEFGRHYGEANKTMKRLANLIMALDMNVVCTAHAKTEYGANLSKIGITFDGWKQLDYIFDLVIELQRSGNKRYGKVVKTRIASFLDGERFEWSYDAIKERYNASILEKEAAVVQLATPQQVKELKELLEAVRLPEGTTEKWLVKAGVETFDDMSADTLAKCTEYVRSRLPGVAIAAA